MPNVKALYYNIAQVLLTSYRFCNL